MKIMVSNESKKVYTRILLSFIIGIVVTLLISSTILYVNFERIALRQVSRTNLNTLMQTSGELSKISETAESVSRQIYQDYAIAPLLLSPEPNIYDYTLAMSQLSTYRLSLPFIESIYIHNAKTEEIFISESKISGRYHLSDIKDTEIVDILTNFQDYPPFIPIPRTFEKDNIENPIVSSYTFLCYNALNKDLDYVVVVNINESWVNDNIGFPQGEESEQTIIINQEGILYSSSAASSMLTDYSKKTYMNRILADKSSSDYYKHTVDGVKSLITYTKPDSLGWRYVRITPYDIITQEISSMRMKTFYYILGFLVLALLISIVMSRRIYVPINKVMHRMRVLESEKRNNLQIIRQEFLRNFILGRETYQAKTLHEKFKYFGSTIEIHGQSVVVLLKIDQYRQCLDKYHDEVKLLKYGIMNICSEIGSTSHNIESVDMGEDTILLLINWSSSDNLADYNSLITILEQMRSSIMDHMKLSVSITISPAIEPIDQIPSLFKQVTEASYHRLFRGSGSLIMSGEIMGMKSKVYEFPVNKQKQLIDSMMTGKIEEAKKIYADIVYETAEYPFTVIQLAISQLTLTINHVLQALKKNNALMVLPEFDNTVVSLNHVESIEEINTQFFQLFDELGKQQDDKRSMKYDDLVNKINGIIEREFNNSNLCLNSIADELTMSPVYISRLYKQLTFQTLTDVISDYRMNKAKEWLLDSGYSIADIAEKTGFTSSSYFYRTFKRATGVTPNDYRKTRIGASS